jgi:hypothetical protein
MLLVLFRIRIKIKIEFEFNWVRGSDPDRNWESGSGSMQAIMVPRKRKI